jgi:cytochrome c oxidase assembly protein subunit 15
VYKEKFFNKVCFLATVSVFLLFVLGGLVRSTGSGMGCPDWPKCFGKLIPPTEEAQLPSNYKDIYLQKRLHKAEKFTHLLNQMGLKELALKVKNDPQLIVSHPYDVQTAYIEYINRLFGVLTGIFSLLAFLSSLQFLRTNIKRFLWILFGLFWVVFNGWLGSVVVDTNLVPGIVTAHYAAAYLAFGSFIMGLPKKHPYILRKSWYNLFKLSFFLLICEVFLGTSTREIIDNLKVNNNFQLNVRTVWVPGNIFVLRQQFTIVGLATSRHALAAQTKAILTLITASSFFLPLRLHHAKHVV